MIFVLTFNSYATFFHSFFFLQFPKFRYIKLQLARFRVPNILSIKAKNRAQLYKKNIRSICWYHDYHQHCHWVQLYGNVWRPRSSENILGPINTAPNCEIRNYFVLSNWSPTNSSFLLHHLLLAPRTLCITTHLCFLFWLILLINFFNHS